MVNDLTTLTGSLQEIIDRLEDNLSDKGIDVSFSSSDGILGLVDEIQNIEVGESDDKENDFIMLYDASYNLSIGGFGGIGTGDISSIDWGDGTVNNSTSHTYATSGIYVIRAKTNGTFTWIMSEVFGGYTGIIGLSLPTTLTSIGEDAFHNAQSSGNLKIVNVYWQDPPTNFYTETGGLYLIPKGATANYIAKSYSASKLIEKFF